MAFDRPAYMKAWWASHKDKRALYGHRQQERRKQKVVAPEEKERRRQYASEYYRRAADKWRVYGRQHYQDRREQYLEYQRAYTAAHRSTISQWRKGKLANNPEYKAKEQKRQAKWAKIRDARERGIFYDLTPEEETAIKSTGCFVCGGMDNLTIAHDIPVVKNGNTTRGNVFCLCRSHNSWMGTKTLAEILEQRRLI